MAGDDDAGAGFGRDHDAMAAAAWQGWRRTTVLVTALSSGLAATGNNIIEADQKSNPEAVPAEKITTADVRIPTPAPPPGAVGNDGRFLGPLALYWPTAQPAKLRSATSAWRAAAETLVGLTARTRTAVDGLAAANPDPALIQMRAFTRQALSPDPTSGAAGVLAVVCRRVSDACEHLAGLTEVTRARMTAKIRSILVEESEWYHPVADVLDVLGTRGFAKAVAFGGDLAMLDLELTELREEHERGVLLIRHELSPIAADHLARLMTAMVPPRPIVADTCTTTSPAGALGAPVPEATRDALIAQAAAAGLKIDPTQVVYIDRAPDGRIIWLQRGDQRSGLGHLLRAERIKNFTDIGVAPADIPGLAVRAVTAGTLLGTIRRDDAVYDVDIGGGQHRRIVVIISDNGYIVSAYPAPRKAKIKPIEGAGR